MMEDLKNKARGQSLMDLIAAMNQDDAGRIPKLAAGQHGMDEEGMEGNPLLTIEIEAGGDGQPEVEAGGPKLDGLESGEPDAMGSGAPDGFEELLKRKLAGG